MYILLHLEMVTNVIRKGQEILFNALMLEPMKHFLELIHDQLSTK